MWRIQYPVTNHGRKTAPLAKQSHKTSTPRTPAESSCAPQLASMFNSGRNSDDKSSSLFRMISHNNAEPNLGSPTAHLNANVAALVRYCCLIADLRRWPPTHLSLDRRRRPGHAPPLNSSGGRPASAIAATYKIKRTMLTTFNRRSYHRPSQVIIERRPRSSSSVLSSFRKPQPDKEVSAYHIIP
jgi:hypothetical protein